MPHRRRLARIAPNALTGLALLLCVGSVGLWVRSYWRGDRIQFAVAHRLMEVDSGPGYVGFAFFNFWCGDRLRWPERESHKIRADDDDLYVPMAYLYRQPYGHDLHFYVPYWIPLGASLVLIRLRAESRRRRTTRARLGLCPRCRYDLTGNVSGVCPECGTPVSPAAGAGEGAGKPATEDDEAAD